MGRVVALDICSRNNGHGLVDPINSNRHTAMMSTRFLVGALVILTLILVVTLGIVWLLS